MEESDSGLTPVLNTTASAGVQSANNLFMKITFKIDRQLLNFKEVGKYLPHTTTLMLALLPCVSRR